jgi:hypothetical protein
MLSKIYILDQLTHFQKELATEQEKIKKFPRMGLGNTQYLSGVIHGLEFALAMLNYDKGVK